MDLIYLHELELSIHLIVPIFQKEYRAVYERSLKETKQKLVQSRVDLIEVDTSKDIVMPLLKYFRMRSAR